MEINILVPKYRKGKKPVRLRKPSKPLDGINHRLLREQAQTMVEEQDENAPPTREELEIKASDLGLKFDGRTSDKKLMYRINEALKGI